MSVVVRTRLLKQRASAVSRCVVFFFFVLKVHPYLADMGSRSGCSWSGCGMVRVFAPKVGTNVFFLNLGLLYAG